MYVHLSLFFELSTTHRPTEARGRRKFSSNPPPSKSILLTTSWHGLNLPPALHSRSLDRNAYALRLDSSVDVSVVLQDMKPASGPGSVESLDLKEIFSRTPSGAPGKFYNSEAGSVLLGTLKTGGPCARVGLLPGEDEEHELNWEKLRDRLENKHMVSHAFLSV